MKKSRKKMIVAYGVATNPLDFQTATASFTIESGCHFDDVFVEEISLEGEQPRFLSTISKMIRKNRVAVLAIPSVSRHLFAHHGPLLKLWCLALQFKVDVKIIESPRQRIYP